MDFLYDNFIANMYGPYFLIFYGVIIALILIGLQIYKGYLDATSDRDAPKIPKQLDPYQIAFLRGGSQELIKVIMFGLVSRGYLKLSGELKVIYKDNDGPPVENLNPVEEEVLRFIGKSATVKSLMEYSVLKSRIDEIGKSFDYEKEENEFVHRQINKDKFEKIRRIGLNIIFFLGSYKFVLAIAKGKQNVGFLIAMGLIGFIITYATKLPKLTRQGKRFLLNLESIFDNSAGKFPDKLNTFNQLLLASIYGFALFDLPEFAFIRRYEKSVNPQAYGGDSGSTCGSGSCSGSCGGGGGCGGGCGGCG